MIVTEVREGDRGGNEAVPGAVPGDRSGYP